MMSDPDADPEAETVSAGDLKLLWIKVHNSQGEHLTEVSG